MAEMRDIGTFKGEPWGSCSKKCLMMHPRAARRGGMCHTGAVEPESHPKPHDNNRPDRQTKERARHSMQRKRPSG